MAPIITQDQWTPSPSQTSTFIIIAVYFVLIGIFWNVKYLDKLIFPFKIVTVGMHEFSHAFAGVLTGAKIEAIELDMKQGGVTRMRGGIQCCTLPGYLGSSFIGAMLIFAGFNVFASKVATIILALMMLATLYWARNAVARISTLFFLAILVALWFIENGEGLRYFVLFMGVMSCMYSLWDILEDLVFRKVNESDASQFAKLIPCIPAQFWGVLWFLISLAFLIGGVLLGLWYFKESDASPNLPSL